MIKDEITKGLKQVDFANKSGNGTGGGGTRGTGGSGNFSGNCFGCGAAGVKQSDCPKCKAKNGSVNLDKIIVNGTNTRTLNSTHGKPLNQLVNKANRFIMAPSDTVGAMSVAVATANGVITTGASLMPRILQR